MEVTHYEDPATHDLYREIRKVSYVLLEELKEAYEKRGKKCWLTFDFNKPIDYMLTINLGKGEIK